MRSFDTEFVEEVSSSTAHACGISRSSIHIQGKCGLKGKLTADKRLDVIESASAYRSQG